MLICILVRAVFGKEIERKSSLAASAVEVERPGYKARLLRRKDMSDFYTNAEKRIMSLNRALTILQDRADKGECDGECDTEKPFTKCQECEAARVLNEINDIARKAL